jgi:hypothetical protein
MNDEKKLEDICDNTNNIATNTEGIDKIVDILKDIQKNLGHKEITRLLEKIIDRIFDIENEIKNVKSEVEFTNKEKRNEQEERLRLAWEKMEREDKK